MFRSYLKFAVVTVMAAGIFLLGQSALAPSRADACRDCPFPMRLADGLWLMPNGLTEIFVTEVNVGGGRVQTSVRLYDAHTGDLLAAGAMDHNKGRKRLKMELVDFAGGSVTIELSYFNAKRTKIQVKMSCEQCNVKTSYLN